MLMTKRGGHKGKSRGQRDDYHKLIKRQAYESTAPEFDYGAIYRKSDDITDDLEDQISIKGRGPSSSQKIFQHFKENWIGYLITAILSIGIVLISIISWDNLSPFDNCYLVCVGINNNL